MLDFRITDLSACRRFVRKQPRRAVPCRSINPTKMSYLAKSSNLSAPSRVRSTKSLTPAQCINLTGYLSGCRMSCAFGSSRERVTVCHEYCDVYNLVVQSKPYNVTMRHPETSGHRVYIRDCYVTGIQPIIMITRLVIPSIPPLPHVCQNLIICFETIRLSRKPAGLKWTMCVFRHIKAHRLR